MTFFFAFLMPFCHSFLPLFLFLGFRELLTFAQHLLLIILVVVFVVAAEIAVDFAIDLDADIAVVAVDLVTVAVDLVAVELAVVVDFVVVAVVVESFSSGHIPNYIWRHCR